MKVAVESGSNLAFDAFWRWLQDHGNCILEAGTADCSLLDHEACHWTVGEDEEHLFVQLHLGKQLLGELLVDREILLVQARPDEGEGAGNWLFELVGGTAEDHYPIYRFVITHGIEDETDHPRALKH